MAQIHHQPPVVGLGSFCSLSLKFFLFALTDVIHIINICNIKHTTISNAFPHNLILITFALSRAESAAQETPETENKG